MRACCVSTEIFCRHVTKVHQHFIAHRVYPYNTGDLTISVNVLYNYLEANSKVPWEDLRYLFGEIMYGGHITDDWDRRLCKTYLEEYMHPDMVLTPTFLPESSTRGT